MPAVSLEPVAEEDKATLASLIQFYRYDFSEVRGYELTEHGTFVYRFLDHYWTEPGRHAFFVRVDGHLAGFVLARQVEGEYEVAEFFVARRHRRAGVGRAAALSLFSRFPGRWTLFHDEANQPAARFWEKVVAEASGGRFEREQVRSSAGFAGRRYRLDFGLASTESPFIPLPDGLVEPRRTAGGVFNGIADLYDRARPGYPAAAVEVLTGTCGVSESSRIVEVGCGTGQLTHVLADTGASILAAEPGDELAALARSNLARHRNVEVHTTRFEDLDAPAGTFDLVVAATSFHWVDPSIGYRQAAGLLRSGGFLALLTNAHASGGNHTDPPFADAVRRIHRRLAPEIGDWTFPGADEIAGRAAGAGDIAAVWARIDRTLGEPPDVSEWFRTPSVRTFPWLATYDCDAYLDMLASQSSYALMESDRRAVLLQGIGSLVDDLLGGRVTKEYVTVLATAARR